MTARIEIMDCLQKARDSHTQGQSRDCRGDPVCHRTAWSLPVLTCCICLVIMGELLYFVFLEPSLAGLRMELGVGVECMRYLCGKGRPTF